MSVDANERKGFLAQMYRYFKHPVQRNADFKAELDALTERDKLDFYQMLNASGFPCDAPSTKQVDASPAAA